VSLIHYSRLSPARCIYSTLCTTQLLIYLSILCRKLPCWALHSKQIRETLESRLLSLLLGISWTRGRSLLFMTHRSSMSRSGWIYKKSPLRIPCNKVLLNPLHPSFTDSLSHSSQEASPYLTFCSRSMF
jgi:hypothetical protein